jgi:hypothetical protein
MVDLYTKTVLTVIAIALAMIAVRPFVQPSSARAGELVDVRIWGVVGAPLPVRCVEGCLSK